MISLHRQNEAAAPVFAVKRSVSGQEDATAKMNKIKAVYMFEVWTAEYDGQREIEFEGRRLTVYRTFDRPDGKTELYTEERAGKVYGNRS